jgi:Copper type II ascorbate-dependent monooxygenase, C-terminal domain
MLALSTACTSGSDSPGSDAAKPDLPPSAASANPQQYTLRMDSFEVAGGAEYYKCQDIPNPFGGDIAIIKTESTVSRGAHHMYAFQIPAEQAAFAPDAGLFAAEAFAPDASVSTATPFVANGAKTPIFDCPAGGLEFHPYIHLTQRAHDVMVYPAGVGRSFKASEAIRFMVHYLNTSDAPIQVGAEITVSYVQPSAAQQVAAGVFVFAGSIEVPPGASTQSFSFPVPEDMTFLQVTGHMHRRGRHYEARVTNTAGETRPLYASDTWDEPTTLNLTPPFVMKQGDTIDYSCSFENDSEMTLGYGESASKNEMCNLFGVFYPAPDGNGVLGSL